MRTTAIVNHKGGVGKTTVTMNLAAELAERGNKVLLIDLDSQGNLTQAAGTILSVSNIEEDEYTIANAISVISNEGELPEVEKYIHRTEMDDNVDIIPNDIRFADTTIHLLMAVNREFMLKGVIEAIESKLNYDYVLIDCGPSIAVDFQNAATAADKIVIVCQGELSIKGMTTLVREAGKVRRFCNPKLSIAGILVNGVANCNFDRSVVRVIKNSFSGMNVFSGFIPFTTAVKEAQSYNMSIGKYMTELPPSKRSDAGQKAAEAFSVFTDEFIDTFKEA